MTVLNQLQTGIPNLPTFRAVIKQGSDYRYIHIRSEGVCCGISWDDALRQSSYPTNAGKYLVYIPLSLVRMAPHFVEANPPI